MSDAEPHEHESRPPRFLGEYLVWILSGLALIAGFVILSLVNHLDWGHIGRDVGIALLVAGVVTAFFELHVRNRSDLETFTSVLNVTMGDVVRKDVWEEVKGQVIQRRMIRENMQVRIRDMERVGGPLGVAILTLEFEYDLKGLHYRRATKVTVEHDLDAHVLGKDMPEYPQLADLPKFDYIEVGGAEVVRGARPDSPALVSPHAAGWKLRYPVVLPPRGKGSLRVVMCRREIFYLPGSYNLAMGEITKGVVLRLDSLPENIEASVNVRPHGEGRPLSTNASLRDFEKSMLLPGQVVEFMFKRVTKNAAAAEAEAEEGRATGTPRADNGAKGER